jgi:hypothetical protein
MADVLELMIAAVHGREFDRLAFLQGLDERLQVGGLVMNELRRCGGRGVKIRLLQDLDGHIRHRLARLDFPIMGNTRGRGRDVAGREPYDLCTGDFSAAEFTGSRIALRGLLATLFLPA